MDMASCISSSSSTSTFKRTAKERKKVTDLVVATPAAISAAETRWSQQTVESSQLSSAFSVTIAGWGATLFLLFFLVVVL